MSKQLDVLKDCDLVAGGYAIDASMLEHAIGWPRGQLKPRIELSDGSGWEKTVRFVSSSVMEGEVTAWEFASADGVTLTVYND